MLYSRLLLVVLFFTAQQAVAMENDAQESVDEQLDWREYYQAKFAIITGNMAMLKTTVESDRFKLRDLINKKGRIEGGLLDVTVQTICDNSVAVAMTEYLLQQGANVDAQDPYGNTVLFKTVKKVKFFNYRAQPFRELEKARMRLLLAHDADPTISNSKGITAIGYIKNSKEIEDILKGEVLTAFNNAVERKKSKTHYNATFALAYRKQIAGFAGLVLPRDMVNPEILRWVTVPPYTQQEIHDGLTKTAEEYAQKNNQN